MTEKKAKIYRGNESLKLIGGGTAIQRLRVERNILAKDCAEALGYEQARYSKVENNRLYLSDHELAILSRLFDCTPEYLLGKIMEEIAKKGDPLATLLAERAKHNLSLPTEKKER